MASAAPNMVNKMKTSSRGELMGLISMLKQKYQGDTLVFVGESSKRHDQIAADVWADYSALKSRGPSN